MSEVLLEAVAARRDASADELPTLYDVIDPGSLDALFRPRHEHDERDSDQTLFFTYAGFEVRVRATGDLTLAPLDGQSSTA